MQAGSESWRAVAGADAQEDCQSPPIPPGFVGKRASFPAGKRQVPVKPKVRETGCSNLVRAKVPP